MHGLVIFLSHVDELADDVVEVIIADFELLQVGR